MNLFFNSGLGDRALTGSANKPLYKKNISDQHIALLAGALVGIGIIGFTLAAVVIQGRTGHQVFTACMLLMAALFSIGAYRNVLFFLGSRKKDQRYMEQLRESAELFATIFENETTGVSLVGLDGAFIRPNGKLCEILGYSQEELLKMKFNDVTYPEDKSIGMGHLKEMVSGQRNKAIFEKRYVHKSGRIIWNLVSTCIVRSATGAGQYFVTYTQDITEHKLLEERLRHDALHDPLTGLGNRSLLLDHLAKLNERKKRSPDLLFAVFFLDFDRFKMVNDSLGHAAGDALLIEAAQRLQQGLRPADRIARLTGPETVARIAGDEFVILLEDFSTVEDVLRVAERVEATLSAPYRIGETEVNLSASIGLVIPDQPYQNPADIIRDADIAMYRAKVTGGARAVRFDPEMQRNAIKKMHLENDLRQAVEQKEFVVYYQPIYAFDSGRITCLEALVRWNSPSRGLLMPDDFIPLAEETGLIAPIGYFVLEEACRQMQHWRETLPGYADLIVSINLSSHQIMSEDLVEKVRTALERTGFDPRRLWLEITETTLVEMKESVRARLNELRSMGIRIEIDDFGTGYSSMSYLQNLPIDGLKIDRSFIREIDGAGNQIVKTLIDLSHHLGLTAVAEGVETETQRDHLVRLDCDYAQGYLMSRPVSAEVVEVSLKGQAEAEMVGVG